MEGMPQLFHKLLNKLSKSRVHSRVGISGNDVFHNYTSVILLFCFLRPLAGHLSISKQACQLFL